MLFCQLGRLVYVGGTALQIPYLSGELYGLFACRKGRTKMDRNQNILHFIPKRVDGTECQKSFCCR